MDVILRQAVITAAVGVLLLSCVPVSPPGPGDGPDDLTVTGSTETPAVFEGSPVTLSGAADGGTPPYLYRWDQNEGPEELNLTGLTDATLTTAPLTTPGRYVFRITVTDSAGVSAVGFVAVEVTEAVSASAPRLIVVGEPAELTAEIDPDADQVTLLWEVIQGDASFDDPASPTPLLTAATGETMVVTLTAGLSPGSGAVTTTREFEIVSVYDLAPQVLLETNFGDITFELDGERAPLHTANFLQYVDELFYDGLLFHRSVCEPDPDSGECLPFVLQGGGYERVGEELQLREATRDPVPSEANNGLSNAETYSISLALFAGDADSGTSQFFINLKDNGFLDDQSFTVFGKVVDGTDVVDAIAALETTASAILPSEQSQPVEDVIMEHVRRASP
jgi:cyclophilin family peptidyl-prolyl cis-trans isomerase